jgi:GntR family transcriptional regulator/MocR family aminotransferase
MRRESPAANFHPQIDQTSPIPAVRQLYLRLREAIMAGRLASGHRLPSTRAASKEWRFSRGLIAAAYDMLIAEGYAVGRHGSGTYVATGLPAMHPSDGRRVGARLADAPRRISAMTAEVMGSPLSLQTLPQIAFVTGRVVHDERTSRLLGHIAKRHIDYRRDGYRDAQGDQELRSAIAAYLAASRGVRCEAGQVFITSGAQQALDLALRVVVTPGEAVLVEDPCHPPARQALVLNGVRVIGMPVDADGLITERLVEASADMPAALYVTPSHQYPAGSALPPARRLQLLAFARETGCWIIEDDYDSEFRYEGHPIASLQGLDEANRVIYLGTFSKSLLPSLRIGYVVVPPDLVAAFIAVRPVLDRFPALFQQRIVADFLNEGYFAAHLRRLRESCRASRDLLVHLLRERLGEHLVAAPPKQGIHLAAHSTGTWKNDRAVSQAAQRRGVVVIPVSPMHIASTRCDRLIFGFSGLSEQEADLGTKRLAKLFARLHSGKTV